MLCGTGSKRNFSNSSKKEKLRKEKHMFDSEKKDQLVQSRKISVPKRVGLSARIHDKSQVEQRNLDHALSVPNRIALLLDTSGSMASRDSENEKPKIELLKIAVERFIQTCNLSDTSIAIGTFGETSEIRTILNCDFSFLLLQTQILEAQGGTPMGEAMRWSIGNLPLTRAVLVSDGEATDGEESIKQAEFFKKAGIPCDCVHIGHSSDGEDRLRTICEITGGVYLKFKNVNSLTEGLKYLTPRFRALLLSSNEVREQIQK
jgi:Mg-chelatase subunit ChlD